eukprot:3268811-Pleurochrysis_carterae.AAC.2
MNSHATSPNANGVQCVFTLLYAAREKHSGNKKSNDQACDSHPRQHTLLASPNEKSRDNVGILLLVLPTASVLELDVGAASAVDLNEVPALHSFHQLRYALFVCLCHAVRKADS